MVNITSVGEADGDMLYVFEYKTVPLNPAPLRKLKSIFLPNSVVSKQDSRIDILLNCPVSFGENKNPFSRTALIVSLAFAIILIYVYIKYLYIYY